MSDRGSQTGTLRWGILGVGDIAQKRAAQAIIDEGNSQLVAACRRNEAKLREFCQRFEVPRAYQADAELIADEDIDIVYVATPVNLHLPQTLAAAKAGKHVLVEKPMACSTTECDQMVDVCREAGVTLGVAYYRRFYPIVLRMKEIIKSGEIGIPMSVMAVTSTPLAMNPGDDGYWRVIPEASGGGALMDMGSHRIDLFLDMFGQVVDGKALCDTLVGDYEGEDCASVVLRFRSGVHGNLQCFFRTNVGADEFIITGTKGRLIASPLNRDKLIVQVNGERRTESHPPATNLHGPLVADFAEAIRTQRQPVVTGEAGRETNQVIELAYANANA
ncbi:MAG: Gfo/Idh/MocA family protein [Gemmataceae bacterium]